MTEAYGFRVHWSDADGGWYAVFSEIPRLCGFGATAEEALAELREVLEAVVDAYRDRSVRADHLCRVEERLNAEYAEFKRECAE